MKVKIGTKTYELVYKVNAVCDLEEMTGCSITDIFNWTEFRSLRALLWAGLITHMPTLTMVEAGDLTDAYMGEVGPEEMGNTIGRAIEAAGFLRAQQIAAAPGKKAAAIKAEKAKT